VIRGTHRRKANRWQTCLMACLAAATFWCASARAQEWPTGQVTIIVPFAAGSTPDNLARIVAEGLQARLRQPFIVENRPGASGNTGTAVVAKAVPDGGTLGVSIVGPLVINKLLFASMPYDADKNLVPISVLAAQPSVLVVNTNLAAQDVAGLLALLKREPDKITYGSIGRGSLSHLSVASLAMQAGVNLVHLPFPGSPAAATALLRGDVQLAVLPAGSVAELAKDGKLRMLAVTSARRSALLPELPTLAEAGIANIEADAWIGLIAPAGVGEALQAKIHREVTAVLAEPEAVARLKAQYMSVIANSPTEFRAVLQQEHDRWAPVIAAGGIKAE
jgi:tripartite-type tricarboxylate transporter receptor subunit TctC